MFKSYTSLNYKDALLQEFITKDMEISLLGCNIVNTEEIIAPGIIEKIREFPANSGGTSFAKIYGDINKFVNVESVVKLFESIPYKGLFSIEFICKNKKLYFIEINFRNDGNCYSITKAGVNLPYLWCLDIAGKDINPFKKTTNKDIYFMLDTRKIKIF